jgi:hypothetical protein
MGRKCQLIPVMMTGRAGEHADLTANATAASTAAPAALTACFCRTAQAALA